MLTDKDAISSALEVLKTEDFYREDNKLIFEAILNLYNRAEPVDISTLKTELNMNLKIAFTGIENTLPTIHKATIHPIITKILEKSKFYHRILF